MKTLNKAEIAIGEGRTGKENRISFCNAWANVQGIHLSKREALTQVAESFGSDKFVIVDFHYDPESNEGTVTYIEK